MAHHLKRWAGSLRPQLIEIKPFGHSPIWAEPEEPVKLSMARGRRHLAGKHGFIEMHKLTKPRVRRPE